MICPNCGNDIEPQGTSIAPPLAVCPSCGRTLVISDAVGLRVATAEDTRMMSEKDKIALRQLRPVGR